MGLCECTCRPLPPYHQLQPTLPGARVFVHWDPGSEQAWAQCLQTPERLESLCVALQLGDPDTEAAALE